MKHEKLHFKLFSQMNSRLSQAGLFFSSLLLLITFNSCSAISFYSSMDPSTWESDPFNLLSDEKVIDSSHKQHSSIRIKIIEDTQLAKSCYLVTYTESGYGVKSNAQADEEKREDLISSDYKLIKTVPLYIKQYAAVQRIEYDDPFGKFSRHNVKASNLNATKTQILPMTEIKWPQKAISFEGLYPGDDNYKLTYRQEIKVYRLQKKQANNKKEQALFKILENSRVKTDERVYWVGACGDMLFDRGVETLILEENGIHKLFNRTLPLLQNADIMIGNLEGAVSERGTPTPKSYHFKFHAYCLKTIAEAGYDYLSINNNHCWDYGEIAFKDTLGNLKKANIPTSGAGYTPQEAAKPFRTSLGDQVVNILSLGAFPQERNGFNGEKQSSVNSKRAGILWANKEGLLAVKKAFANDQHLNIIMVHGGTEWTNSPSANQKKLYRQLVDLNADLVLGSHPHELQGLQGYKKSLIAYSLGNFIFPDMWMIKHGEETLIQFTGFYQGRPLFVEPVAVQIDNIPIDLPENRVIMDRLSKLTQGLNKD